MGLFRKTESERAARKQAELTRFRASFPYAHKMLGAEGDLAWNAIEAIERVCVVLDELEQRLAALEH